jgi:hypothetical protein
MALKRQIIVVQMQESPESLADEIFVSGNIEFGFTGSGQPTVQTVKVFARGNIAFGFTGSGQATSESAQVNAHGLIAFGFEGSGQASVKTVTVFARGNIGFGFEGSGRLSEFLSIINVRGNINFGFEVEAFPVFNDPTESDSLLLDISIYEPQPAGLTFYKARLRNGIVEMPITDYSLNEADGLGITVDVTLAIVDLNLINSTDELILELGLKTGGAGTYQWYKLAEGLRRAGRSRNISFQNNLPADSVSMTFRDSLAEKIEAAPLINEFIYDVFKMDKKPDVKSFLIDETGKRIGTKVIGVGNLRLKYLLNRAYVKGCGFSSVKSSIDNIPVDQAAFTLQSGYHGTIAGIIGNFKPVYKVENNNLIIFDAGGQIPANTSIIDVPLDNNVRVLNDKSGGGRRVQRMIISYSAVETDDILLYTNRPPEYDPAITNGEFGDPGFTENQTRRVIRDYYYESEPENIVKSVNKETVIEIHRNNELISSDKLIEEYDSRGNKKSHLRTVEAVAPTLPEGNKALQIVMEESLQVTYRVNPFNNTEIVQDTLVITQSGLVVTNNDIAPFGESYRIPYLDSISAGYLDPTADQTIDWAKLRTTFKSLQIVSASQLNLVGQTINELTGALEESFNEPTPGTSIIPKKRVSQRQQVIGFVPEGEKATRTESFDGGDLPPSVVFKLAKRRLAELQQNPFDISIDLTYFSPILEYGAYIRPFDRAGAMNVFLVTGRRLTGQNLGREGQLITTNLTAREVISYE